MYSVCCLSEGWTCTVCAVCLRDGHVQCVMSVWGLDMYSVCCLSECWRCTVCAVCLRAGHVQCVLSV